MTNEQNFFASVNNVCNTYSSNKPQGKPFKSIIKSWILVKSLLLKHKGKNNISWCLTGEFLISWRNSERAESACWRISWLESLNILNKPDKFMKAQQSRINFPKIIKFSTYKWQSLPSRKSGRKPSISISGTLSNTVIHPTKNWRTYGFRTFIRSLNNGINSSILKIRNEKRRSVKQGKLHQNLWIWNSFVKCRFLDYWSNIEVGV